MISWDDFQSSILLKIETNKIDLESQVHEIKCYLQDNSIKQFFWKTFDLQMSPRDAPCTKKDERP